MVSVDTSHLVVEETDDVVSVRLSRPDKLNALGPEMVRGLADVFSQLADQPGRGVLLTGEGRATCAGMDQDIVSDDYHAEHGDLDDVLQGLYRQIEDHPGPVALAGHGAVVGAATLISLSCEFLVLGEGTTFAIPEVQYDIASTRGATVLPGYVGHHVAAEMLLTGEELAPERAHDLGLANDVVPAEDVEERARELLETVAEHDDETVAAIVEKMPDVTP